MTCFRCVTSLILPSGSWCLVQSSGDSGSLLVTWGLAPRSTWHTGTQVTQSQVLPANTPVICAQQRTWSVDLQLLRPVCFYRMNFLYLISRGATILKIQDSIFNVNICFSSDGSDIIRPTLTHGSVTINRSLFHVLTNSLTLPHNNRLTLSWWLLS